MPIYKEVSLQREPGQSDVAMLVSSYAGRVVRVKDPQRGIVEGKLEMVDVSGDYIINSAQGNVRANCADLTRLEVDGSPRPE